MDEIYQNLEKLESDINHDYVMEDLTSFIQLEDDGLMGDEQQLLTSQLNLVIANQYEILQEKFRLKYGGQTLAQLVAACQGQSYTD